MKSHHEERLDALVEICGIAARLSAAGQILNKFASDPFLAVLTHGGKQTTREAAIEAFSKEVLAFDDWMRR